jgi:hypothetical protein
MEGLSLISYSSLVYSRQRMSEDGKSATTHPSPSLPSCVLMQEKKEARKKLLRQIEKRRKENYKLFLEKKRRLRTKGDVV